MGKRKRLRFRGLTLPLIIRKLNGWILDEESLRKILIHTSLQRGDEGTYLNKSRFNGFSLETIEMVYVHMSVLLTPR